MSKKKAEFGDIKKENLVKRTLMVSAFPAMIRQKTKEGKVVFEGLLPGFEFKNIKEFKTENECVEYLQNLLDDEVEELIVFGKTLPFVEDDDELIKKYQGYKIVFLDINVYASPQDLEDYAGCSHNCSCCEHNCKEEDYNYDKYNDSDKE